MRSVVFDFELTVLWPILVMSGVLWWLERRAYSIMYAEYQEINQQLKAQSMLNAVDEGLLARREDKFRRYVNAGILQRISATTFIVSIGVLLLSDFWKMHVAEVVWKILFGGSIAAFIVAVPMAWHYAKTVEWIKLGVCVLVIIVSLSGAEHFFHQNINAHHIVCPKCDDDDAPPDDQ